MIATFVLQVEIMLTLGHRATQKAVQSEEGECDFWSKRKE